MRGSLFVEERRRAILERLERQGRVSVKALSDLMNVSTVTIRQDLRALEDNGFLDRTYGGAVRRELRAVPPELSFQVRLNNHRAQKDLIAEACVQMVQNGDCIALDASTTAYALVGHLKAFECLTVVTNSLIIAQSFLDSPQIQVLLPGGRVRRDSVSLVGRPETLPDINLKAGFFGARGLSLMGGISDVDAEEAAIKQALRARCVAPVIVADGSKWDQVAPYTFATLAQTDRIITTSDAPQDHVCQFREAGARVDVVALQRSESLVR
ncbi:MAG: DeoR/GlpR transcriptional regulator [Chloroflexi bacterium]|nr:DeoR/GlpR transcriptional regulator [Chloroflexota bacterium]